MQIRVFALFVLLLAAPLLAQEPAPDQPVLELFDIRDLVDGDEEVDGLVRALREAGGEGIEQLVPKQGRVLVVVARKEALRRIKEHIEELRRLRSRVVTLEVRFLKLPAVDVLGLPEGESAGRISAERLTALLDGLDRPGGGELASAPRLTCYPDQEAEIVVGRQISYVRKFEVKRGEGGVIADPVVDTARDGFFLKATPSISETPGAVDVDLDLTLAEVAQPILTRKRLLERGQKVPVEVQVPQVTELRIVRSATVPDGGTHGIDAGPIPFAGFAGNHLVILVTARVTTLEGREKEK